MIWSVPKEQAEELNRHPRPEISKAVVETSHKSEPYQLPISGFHQREFNLEASFILISPLVRSLIGQRQRLAEDKIYLSTVADDTDYLGRVYEEEPNLYIRDAISHLINSIHAAVQTDIWGGHFDVKPKTHVTKDQLKSKESPLHIRILGQRIKQGLLSLKQSFQSSFLQSSQPLQQTSFNPTQALSTNPGNQHLQKLSVRSLQTHQHHLTHNVAEERKLLSDLKGRESGFIPGIVHKKSEQKITEKSMDIWDRGGMGLKMNGLFTIEQIYGRVQENSKAKRFQAEKFVKKMQEQRMEKQKKKEERKRIIEERSVQSMIEKNQINQHLKAERHAFLTNRYKKKRKEKEQQKVETLRNEENYLRALIAFKQRKPLFQQKEEQFYKKFVIEENSKKMQILHKIKIQRKPLDLDELDDHERRYLEFKQERQEAKLKAFQLEQRMEEERSSNRYFKGRFHNLPEDPPVFRRPDATLLYKRRKTYSQNVKSHHLPKKDEIKAQEMWELRKSLQNKTLAPGDAREDGYRNLQKLHHFIEEKRNQGLLKRPVEDKPNTSHIPYKDYLNELRDQARIGRKSTQTNYQNLAGKNPELTTLQAQKLEERAKMRDRYLIHANTIDLSKHLEEKSKAQNQYIESARAKLALLAKFG